MKVRRTASQNLAGDLVGLFLSRSPRRNAGRNRRPLEGGAAATAPVETIAAWRENMSKNLVLARHQRLEPAKHRRIPRRDDQLAPIA